MYKLVRRKMNYYNEIKNKLIDNEIYSEVKDYSKERHRVITYFEIGRLIVEAQGGCERAKYGNGLIKMWSRELTELYGKGYDYTNPDSDITDKNSLLTFRELNYLYNLTEDGWMCTFNTREFFDYAEEGKELGRIRDSVYHEMENRQKQNNINLIHDSVEWYSREQFKAGVFSPDFIKISAKIVPSCTLTILLFNLTLCIINP